MRARDTLFGFVGKSIDFVKYGLGLDAVGEAVPTPGLRPEQPLVPGVCLFPEDQEEKEPEFETQFDLLIDEISQDRYQIAGKNKVYTRSQLNRYIRRLLEREVDIVAVTIRQPAGNTHRSFYNLSWGRLNQYPDTVVGRARLSADITDCVEYGTTEDEPVSEIPTLIQRNLTVNHIEENSYQLTDSGKIYTLRELNRYIRRLIRKEVDIVAVTTHLSTGKNQRSFHYFSWGDFNQYADTATDHARLHQDIASGTEFGVYAVETENSTQYFHCTGSGCVKLHGANDAERLRIARALIDDAKNSKQRWLRLATGFIGLITGGAAFVGLSGLVSQESNVSDEQSNTMTLNLSSFSEIDNNLEALRPVVMKLPLLMGLAYQSQRMPYAVGFSLGLSHLMGYVQAQELDLESNLVAYYPFDNNANDASGHANHCTTNGNLFFPDRLGNAESALYFDGNNDYLGCPDSADYDGTDKLTISFWINFYSFGGSICHSPDCSPLINKFFSADTGSINAFSVQEYENRILFVTSDGGAFQNVYASAEHNFNAQTWHSVILTFNGTGSQDIYYDGVLAASVPSSISSIFSSPRPLYIGAIIDGAASNNGLFHGIIDEIRFYKGRVFSPDDIQRLYLLESGVSYTTGSNLSDDITTISSTSDIPQTTNSFDSEELPVLNIPINDKVFLVDQIIEIDIPDDTFLDPLEGVLTYEANQEDGSDLPNGLQFNRQTLQFFGAINHPDEFSIKIEATNARGKNFDVFLLLVNANTGSLNNSSNNGLSDDAKWAIGTIAGGVSTIAGAVFMLIIKCLKKRKEEKRDQTQLSSFHSMGSASSNQTTNNTVNVNVALSGLQSDVSASGMLTSS